MISLAELAWLAAFGLLFAYRGKVGEVGTLRRRVAEIEVTATDVSRLMEEREVARRQAADLQLHLNAIEQELGGKSATEVVSLLKAAGDAEQRIRLAEENAKTLGEELS
ncbi:MAG: hypothetical protein KIT22_10590, partial [Verrucomicrobiae bacterium]|nr:hypothetical protein [Verrucomicrobiae bacterium]